MATPSGTVTFLFTDIEGSTRRWESDPDGMRAALAAHDEVLRSAIGAHGGWLFKHTGDGVCAAFGSARAAIDAAVEGQRGLALAVRMGVASGEVEQRDGDYFGPALNRAARVMAAGHGGQILVAASAAALVSGVDLVDLGEHRLRDLSQPTRLFQVTADGLRSEFPALRTIDAVPGNLPVQSTSFVGREVEVEDRLQLVRKHRLVTLTGVGGVGKSRLAVQVAAQLVGEFPHGVWLVELAPVGDPADVPDVAAAVLGIIPMEGQGVTHRLARVLSGRRTLIVLDNCEHVLDAAADLVDAILARTSTVTVIATSREGLAVKGEHLWPVPSLALRGGAGSQAVALFVERALAVNPSFQCTDPDRADAVTEICRRLDGIALAIELAAARMVSMSPQDVRDRLDDRFRLLSGSRRGVERHQTLRHAVGWSHDLLDDAERVVLQRCSVFVDGFDLAAAAHLNDDRDEYTVLDVLDSLVRKSLLTVDQTQDHARYGLLETIRQFAEEQLAASGSIEQVRNRHARYFAEQAIAYWDLCDGSQPRVALDWVDAEFANLRAAFRWAADHDDVITATAIAAHTTMLAHHLMRFEPAGWAEEILPAATRVDLPQLARLYTAASLCSQTGRTEAAVGYAAAAVGLESDPRYDHFGNGWSRAWEAIAEVRAARFKRGLAIWADLAAQSGPGQLHGRCGLIQHSAILGRDEAVRTLAEETVVAARTRANPYFIAYALYGYGLAFADTDPSRSLDAFRQALAHSRDHRLVYMEAQVARAAARAEALHGDPDQALTLFDHAIGSFHQSGNDLSLALTFAYVAVFFDRVESPAIAATLYGAANHIRKNIISSHVVAHLRNVLGDADFERCVAIGAAMELTDAARYARDQIRLARAAKSA